MRTTVAFFFSVALLVAAGLSVANSEGPLWTTPVSRSISYQGVLERGGAPVQGIITFRFEIFAQESGGAALWSETHENVRVTTGRFAVRIGEHEPLPDAVFEAETLFVQIHVDDGSAQVLLKGRQQLLPVPYAVRSEHALKANRSLEAEHGVPAGTIVAYVAEVAPTGWMVCDGTRLEVAAFPDLYAAIGDRFGYETQGTDFLLPDLRGQFLRGWSNNSSVDPDAMDRTAWNRGASGDSIGSRQPCGIEAHDHTWAHYDNSAGHQDNDQNWDTTPRGAPRREYLTGSTGGSETRPVNVAVNFIIKCGAADDC